MRVLFLSANYPPEVNAPATRLYEHAKQWVADGGEVEVVTDPPNYPEGVVYEGYENRYCKEEGTIEVHRVPMYLAENKGGIQRILSYLSFMMSAIWFSRKARHADVVVATSPQFFTAVAGYVVSRIKRVPFVLEIRDLWPESIVAVGAMSRNTLIKLFERVERFLYRNADHVVVVTNAFATHVIANGAKPESVTVLMNGADLERAEEPLDDTVLGQIRDEHGFDGKFVAAYAGTIGMAHRADVVLEAAQRCPDPDILWTVIGTGAERADLEDRAAVLGLDNFRLIDKQTKDRIRYFHECTDVAIVHLRDTPLFRTVIPSKLFEAMAAGIPIVHGVRGESAGIVEASGAGLVIEPEDADALVAAVQRLKDDRDLYNQLSQEGPGYVRAHHDRRALARRYWALLERVAAGDLSAPLLNPLV